MTFDQRLEEREGSLGPRKKMTKRFPGKQENKRQHTEIRRNKAHLKKGNNSLWMEGEMHESKGALGPKSWWQ